MTKECQLLATGHELLPRKGRYIEVVLVELVVRFASLHGKFMLAASHQTGTKIPEVVCEVPKRSPPGSRGAEEGSGARPRSGVPTFRRSRHT